jgi:hypothetical protein
VACGQLKNSGKAGYLFSVNEADGKILHASTLPPTDLAAAPEWNAKLWMDSVSKVIGGKVLYLLSQYSNTLSRPLAFPEPLYVDIEGEGSSLSFPY